MVCQFRWRQIIFFVVSLFYLGPLACSSSDPTLSGSGPLGGQNPGVTGPMVSGPTGDADGDKRGTPLNPQPAGGGPSGCSVYHLSPILPEGISDSGLFEIEASGEIIGDDSGYYPPEGPLSVSISGTESGQQLLSGKLVFGIAVRNTENKVISFVRDTYVLSDPNVELATYLNLSVTYWVDHRLFRGVKEYRKSGIQTCEEDLGTIALDFVLEAPENSGLPSAPGAPQNPPRFQDPRIADGGEEAEVHQLDPAPACVQEGRVVYAGTNRRPCRVAKNCPVGYDQYMEAIRRVNEGDASRHPADKLEFLDFLKSNTVSTIRRLDHLQGLPGFNRALEREEALARLRDLEEQVELVVNQPCHWAPPTDVLDADGWRYFRWLDEIIPSVLEGHRSPFVDQIEIKDSLHRVVLPTGRS